MTVRQDDSGTATKAALANMDTVEQPSGDKGGGKIRLERKITLTSAIALIVGTMIGSGIFISPKGVLRGTGSIGMSLVIWAACGVLAMLATLSYIELGLLIRESGSEYIYILRGLSSLKKDTREAAKGRVRERGLAGAIGFMAFWTSFLITRPAQAAIMTYTFGVYTVKALTNAPAGCTSYFISEKIFAASLLFLLAFINCFSVKLATRVQSFFAAAKLLACAVIIIGGFVKLGQGHTEHLNTGFEGTTTSPLVIAIAFYNGLWAYDGWNNLNYVTEELKNPTRNLPLAICIGIPLVTVCYLLVNISYFTVMSPMELLASPAVAVTWGDNVLGVMAWLIPVSVAFSTFGAANGTLFSSGRLCYVAAREGHLVQVMSMVHVKRKTPAPALMFTAVVALMMIIPGSIDSLIDFFSFAAWMFYGLTMAALLIMRRTKKDAPRPYKVPTVIPVIVLVASVYLVFAPIIDRPHIGFLLAFLVILSGLLFYIPFVHFGVKWKYIDYVTIFLQKVIEVVPTDDGDDEEGENGESARDE